MFEFIRSNQRGKANFGWLKSQHTFSFGQYYNPNQMGFSKLRVINDDWVAPGYGFDTHGHRNMEIISYVLTGAIEHKDSAGNAKILPAGEFQLMSAGKGIFHSEYNASGKDDLTFLQIWIEPNQLDGPAGYQQKDFGQNEGLTKVITPNGTDGTLSIKQDMSLYQIILDDENLLDMPISADRAYYLHLVNGEISVGEQKMVPGDGLKISGVDQMTLKALQGPVKALWFDLPAVRD